MSRKKYYAALSGSDTMTKNIVASIRQKLKNKSQDENRPFAELLQYYAMERFLYRLTQSSHAERFILKGALMLRVWNSPEVRPTMDIDMLGKTDNEIDSICQQITEIASIESDDGLVFDGSSIKSEQITEDADYEGVRVRFNVSLDNARVVMQIDIGFGDVVHPEPVLMTLPTLLNSSAPKLLCYSRESAIAEKFEAMIKLSELNSRMKDFYDIWLLSRQFEFDEDDLSKAIKLTLENRQTELPVEITAFSPEFVQNKQKQWEAFRNRLGQDHTPIDFSEIVDGISSFLKPVIQQLR